MDRQEALDSCEITRVLKELRHQPQLLRERLFPLLYDSMRQIARRQMRAERHARTLQPTALVHEAYIRLANSDWESRAHFLACASNVMRQILVDCARRRISRKRGAGLEPVTFNDFAAARPVSLEDILTVDMALVRLRQIDFVKAELLQLKFFGGMTMAESTSVMGLGLTAAKEHFRLAKAWLNRELSRKKIA
jgi:RNA polymerase sigma factor (TIGR02999 family)